MSESKWRKKSAGALRFSNDDTEQILALVDNHMRFGQAMRMSESTFKKFVRMPHFDEHLELHRLDCLASVRRFDHLRLHAKQDGDADAGSDASCARWSRATT